MKASNLHVAEASLNKKNRDQGSPSLFTNTAKISSRKTESNRPLSSSTEKGSRKTTRKKSFPNQISDAPQETNSHFDADQLSIQDYINKKFELLQMSLDAFTVELQEKYLPPDDLELFASSLTNGEPLHKDENPSTLPFLQDKEL